MGEKTNIAWTDHTFNIAWGCRKVDPGCQNCYAETFSKRLGWSIWTHGARRTFGGKHWQEPLRWEERAKRGEPGVLGPGKPQLVFCSSMCDIFEDHPVIDHEREKLWPLIRRTPHLHWQLLTKRADRIRECLPSNWGEGYPNVWLGVSISEGKGAWREWHLGMVPARVRFISYEPALGPLNVHLDLEDIDWVIYGGESGPGFRPDEREWAVDMESACMHMGVAFFFKQRAGRVPGDTRGFKPVRQFPVVHLPRRHPATHESADHS